MKKKILLITTSFQQKANSAAIRNNSLVKGLIENGCDVEVLTVQWPKHLLSDYFVLEQKCKITKTNIPFLLLLKKIHQVRVDKASNVFSKMKKVIRDAFFFPDICMQWVSLVDVRLLGEYDLIISSSDLKSSHFVGKKIKDYFPNIKWMQIWGDPWSDDIAVSGFNKIRAKINEKKILSKADFIVYVSDLTRKLMVNKYKKISNKIYFVPRGYYIPIKKENKDTLKSIYRIIYTGSLSSGRNYIDFIKSADAFNKSSERKINIEFYGNYIYDTVFKLESFSCVKVFSSVDYEQVLKIYASADALLYISNEEGATQIPGKLYDYMSTELPIICLVNKLDTDQRQILSKSKKCKVWINTEESIKENLNDLIFSGNDVYPIELLYSPQNIARQVLNIAFEK